MSALERRVAQWSEVIGDLLLQHLVEFPRRAIGEAITDDFGSTSSWNWKDGDSFGFELREPVPGWPEVITTTPGARPWNCCSTLPVWTACSCVPLMEDTAPVMVLRD